MIQHHRRQSSTSTNHSNSFNTSPRVDVKPSISPIKPTNPQPHPSLPPPHSNCTHQPRPLWVDDSPIIKNLTIALEALESGSRLPYNLTTICSHCRSGTGVKIICLGCGGSFCLIKKSGEGGARLGRCYETHSAKSSKCLIGIDTVCREFICLGCGDLVRPDDSELKTLSRKLYAIKRPFLPSCMNRTTQHIFPPRGFRNLGKSCYMNVILQILLRIPEFQCYLLMDHHNRHRHHPNEDEPICCVCELVGILQGTVTGEPTKEITPVGFLYTLWLNSGNGEDLAGYREADAHECLLSCLNQFHSATQVFNPPDPTCYCPIHLLFRCELQSELICGTCQSTSHKVDPILDLSLEIGHLGHLDQLKLTDCLQSYTQTEALKEKCYTCTACQVASPATTKSLKISKLPHVLCIQLKRFEHRGTSVKIERFVQFPLILDMRPYTTSPRTSEDSDQPGYYYKLTGIVSIDCLAGSGSET